MSVASGASANCTTLEARIIFATESGNHSAQLFLPAYDSKQSLHLDFLQHVQHFIIQAEQYCFYPGFSGRVPDLNKHPQPHAGNQLKLRTIEYDES